MQDPATLPNDQLLEMFKAQCNELAVKDDIIKQLEEKNNELELAYNKLWRERFEARSERYISDPGHCAWTLATPLMPPTRQRV